MKKSAIIVAIIAVLALAIILFARVDAISPQPSPSAPATPAAAFSPEPTPSPEPTVRPSETFVTEYEATDVSTGGKVRKNMAVYLPEGYDENGEYNTVFLMHVSGSDENFWLGLGIQEIMDGLISSGAVEPMIVFMPDGYISDDIRGIRNNPAVYTQFASEFRDDILPFVREYYAVHDGRDHYGFYGASFGAYLTVNSILEPNLDLVSYYGYVGGGEIDINELESSWLNSGNSDYEIGMFYIGEGSMDDRGPVELSYMTLRDHCDKFSENNLRFTLMDGIGHDATEWSEGLKEALQLFFR